MEITREQLKECGPSYYCDKNLDRLLKGKDSISWKDMLESDVSAKDKIWLATRPDTLLPLEMQKQLADVVADRAVKNHCLSCGIKSAETWAKSWLDGTDRSKSSAYAADSATSTTMIGRASANYAARAAFAAADGRASDAVVSSTFAAAIGANADVEIELQVDDLRKLIMASCSLYTTCKKEKTWK